jgi:hypothetical protein
MHEIGNASPYRLFFAGKGKSGASFGFMQGDLAAKQPVVTNTFTAILNAEGFTNNEITHYLALLSVHVIGNPLTNVDTDRINAALLHQSTRVDQMDEQILGQVYTDLDKCYAAAKAANCTINPTAAIMMALWINMSGPPSKLLTWLGGGDPHLTHPIPAAAARVTGTQMEAYLRATDYFSENPGNFPHFLQSVNAGVALLP